MVNLDYITKRQALDGFHFLPLFYALPQPLYLDIRGGISNYSYRDPFVILAYSLPLWASYLEVAGFSRDTLATFPDHAEARYMTEEQTDTLCKDMAKIFWHDPNIKAKQILEIVHEHRDHKDFSERKSNVRIDFHRKYYHTRTKSKLVKIDDVWKEATYVPDDDYDLENVVANNWVNKFYGWLGGEKDINICRLRCLGCTQQEIADRLGYKNHSGVNKRIKYIGDILEAYIEWQHDLEKEPPLSAPELSKIRYQEIEFSYARKN